MHSFWEYPFATILALYLSMSPFKSLLILYIHLDTMAVLLLGRGYKEYVLFSSMAYISTIMVATHFSL